MQLFSDDKEECSSTKLVSSEPLVFMICWWDFVKYFYLLKFPAKQIFSVNLSDSSDHNKDNINFYIDKIKKKIHLFYCNVKEFDLFNRINWFYGVGSVKWILENTCSSLSFVS